VVLSTTLKVKISKFLLENYVSWKISNKVKSSDLTEINVIPCKHGTRAMYRFAGLKSDQSPSKNTSYHITKIQQNIFSVDNHGPVKQHPIALFILYKVFFVHN